MNYELIPYPVQAFQVTETMQQFGGESYFPTWARGFVTTKEYRNIFRVCYFVTLPGDPSERVNTGWWIIRHPSGAFEQMSDSLFRIRYREVSA